MQPKPPRPTGVTILGILAILGGLAGLFSGFILIVLGLLLGTLLTATEIADAIAASGYPGLSGLGVEVLSTIVIVIGVVVLILGILYLAVGIGFFGGRGWAWTLGMIGSVLQIVLSIIQIAFGNYGSAFGLIIAVLILYYLMRPHVKAFFGKGSTVPPAVAPPS